MESAFFLSLRFRAVGTMQIACRAFPVKASKLDAEIHMWGSLAWEHWQLASDLAFHFSALSECCVNPVWPVGCSLLYWGGQSRGDRAI